MNAITTFSGRAECKADLDEFVAATGATVTAIKTFELAPGLTAPDVMFELTSRESLAYLVDAARRGESCHVLAETLRPCAVRANSMERRDETAQKALAAVFESEVDAMCEQCTFDEEWD